VPPRRGSLRRLEGARNADPGARAIGERAARNTLVRAGSEVLGRLASLILFGTLGHEVGAEGLGAFVFALAYLQLLTLIVELGYDRFLVRHLAREPDALGRTLFDVVALKLGVGIPLFAVAAAALSLTGASQTTQHTTWLLAAGVLSDSLARTMVSVFSARERLTPVSAGLLVQRVLAAALGLAVLAGGAGVATVALTYSIGSLVGLAVPVIALARTGDLRPVSVRPARWRPILRRSLPFAQQDVLSVTLARADTVLLSILASAGVVGVYGAAYRLFESTFFVSASVLTAFNAMFTYLTTTSDPPVGSAYARALKVALVALVPAAVVFAVVPEQIVTLIYGDDLAGAAGPLRLLGPTTLVVAAVGISSSLIVSRRSPRVMVLLTAAGVAINIVANLVLIPARGADGAAAAMLLTELAFGGAVIALAGRTVGGVRWVPLLAGPVAAGAAMAAVTGLLAAPLGVVLVAGVAAYGLVLVLVERWSAPEDLRFVMSLLPGRA